MSTPLVEHADPPPSPLPGPIGPGVDVPWALPGDWPKGPVQDLSDIEWAHEAGPFSVHGFTFTIRTTNRLLGEHFDELLDHIRAPGAEHQYSLTPPGMDGDAKVYLDARLLRATTDEAAAYRHLLWHLNRMAIYAASDKLLFHAAAATWNGGALLLPAPMESGKTTLVAGLVERGMDYLTDEAAAVDFEAGQVHPYPKALSIDPGSWRLFPRLCPSLPRELRQLTRRQWQVSPTVIRPDSVAGPTPCRWVVFPTYAPGGSTTIRPVPPGAAVARLVASSFNVSWHRRRGFYGIVELVKACASYELSVADLSDACDLVREVTNA